jgi:clan AA aspartic protease (TIGR02281 family)
MNSPPFPLRRWWALLLPVLPILAGCMGPNTIDANGNPIYVNNCLIKMMCLDIPANRPRYGPNPAALTAWSGSVGSATSQYIPGRKGKPIRPTRKGSVLAKKGGTFVVPVTVNNTLQLAFIVDSGASDVSIPADVVLTLMRAGTITNTDFLGRRTYRLADGSVIPSTIVRIRSLRVGDQVLENVIGSVAPVAGTLLLGQSFLSRFRSWSIDNRRMVLVLE